jgi:hypothetical protein
MDLTLDFDHKVRCIGTLDFDLKSIDLMQSNPRVFEGSEKGSPVVLLSDSLLSEFFTGGGEDVRRRLSGAGAWQCG